MSLSDEDRLILAMDDEYAVRRKDLAKFEWTEGRLLLFAGALLVTLVSLLTVTLGLLS